MLTVGGDIIILMLIDRIASDNVLDAAYSWLCEKRSHYHFNGDVWQVRRWWHEKKPLLQHVAVVLSIEEFERLSDLEDELLAFKAEKAQQEGFLGATESEALLEELLNAED